MCRGRIVKAHTVSRSALARIAQNGHVLAYNPDIFRLDARQGWVEPARCGIRAASTFTGFCAEHDREMFSCVENRSFDFEPQQTFALMYRGVARELFIKSANVLLNKRLLADPLLASMPGGNRFEELARVGRLSVRDLSRVLEDLASAYRSQTFTEVASFGMAFEGRLSMLCSGIQIPFRGFAGEIIQDLTQFEDFMDPLVFTIVPAASNRIAVQFAWLREHRAGANFCASFTSAPRESWGARAQAYATISFENMYFSPAWWEEIDQRRRSLVVARLNQNIAPDRDFVSLAGCATPCLERWRLVDVVDPEGILG